MTQILLVLGVIFRLRQYLHNRSLWMDECLIALNLMHRTAFQLLKPLDYHQAAPFGFLLLEKLAASFLGPSEMPLRLVALIAGIASLFLMATLCRRLLSPAGTAIAVGIFVFSEPLNYYSSEVKQYSLDVAVVLCLMLVADAAWEDRCGALKAGATVLAGCVAVWFSQPATFVVAGIGVTWLWVSIRRRDRTGVVEAILFGVATAASFFVLYLLSFRYLLHDDFLTSYWKDGFMPTPSPVKSILWCIDSWIEFTSYPLGVTFAGITTVAALFGAYELYRTNRKTLSLMLMPILFALLACGLHRYPLQGRLLLFAVPPAVVLIAHGLANLESQTRSAMPGLGVLMIGVFFFQPVQSSFHYLHTPKEVEELRTVVDYVQRHREPGDAFYGYYGALRPLLYYNGRNGNPSMTIIPGVESRSDWEAYRRDLSQLQGRSRAWIIFSHIHKDSGIDEELLFRSDLDAMGRRKDEFHATGASAYLYDLSGGQ